MEIDDGGLYHSLIKSRSRQPVWFGRQSSVLVLEAYNAVCGDQFQLFVDMSGEALQRVTFTGYGCAISKAATDLLLDQLQDTPRSAAAHLVRQYLDMLEARVVPPAWEASDLLVFQPVWQFPERLECAALSARAMMEFLGREGRFD